MIGLQKPRVVISTAVTTARELNAPSYQPERATSLAGPAVLENGDNYQRGKQLVTFGAQGDDNDFQLQKIVDKKFKVAEIEDNSIDLLLDNIIKPKNHFENNLNRRQQASTLIRDETAVVNNLREKHSSYNKEHLKHHDGRSRNNRSLKYEQQSDDGETTR